MLQLRRGYYSGQNTIKYDVFIIILTTCFGLDNGPSSGQKTHTHIYVYMRIIYNVIYKKRYDKL